MLDIDRERQRIWLGLKQTQEDPWQRVVDTYNISDELEGTVTKVVTFGAFVEILDGVEGLVHISELAQHHVENPREIIQPGDPVRVKILEIDSERRRLSLSIKRVEGQVLPVRPIVPPVDGEAGVSTTCRAGPVRGRFCAGEAAPPSTDADAAGSLWKGRRRRTARERHRRRRTTAELAPPRTSPPCADADERGRRRGAAAAEPEAAAEEERRGAVPSRRPL